MVGMRTLSVTIVVILCCVPYLLSKEGVSYKLQRNACQTFNSKFIYNTSCRVRHINRTAQLLNLEINFQPNVSINNIRYEITTYYKFGTVFRPRAMYAKYSNMLEPCPKSGKIYIKNMLIDSSHFPQFFSVGEWRCDTKTFTYMNGEEEVIILTQDYFEVKALGILQF